MNLVTLARVSDRFQKFTEKRIVCIWREKGCRNAWNLTKLTKGRSIFVVSKRCFPLGDSIRLCCVVRGAVHAVCVCVCVVSVYPCLALCRLSAVSVHPLP